MNWMEIDERAKATDDTENKGRRENEESKQLSSEWNACNYILKISAKWLNLMEFKKVSFAGAKIKWLKSLKMSLSFIVGT